MQMTTNSYSFQALFKDGSASIALTDLNGNWVGYVHYIPAIGYIYFGLNENNSWLVYGSNA